METEPSIGRTTKAIIPASVTVLLLAVIDAAREIIVDGDISWRAIVMAVVGFTPLLINHLSRSHQEEQRLLIANELEEE